MVRKLMDEAKAATSEDRSASRRGTPLVSVAFATIGRMDYMEQVLSAISGQTYANTEVLLLDNASPSPARERLEVFAASTPGARLLRVEERLPMFRNFNRGIEAARGDYIAFFHDDDVYLPTFLDHFVELLRKWPSAGFAGGNYSIIDREGKVDRSTSAIPVTACWSGKQFIETLVSSGRSPVPTPGLVFRREAIAAQGFDETVSINWGDFPIFMKIAEGWDVAVSSEIHYSWRVHGENHSNVPWSKTLPDRSALLSDYLDGYKERRPEESEFIDRLRRAKQRMELKWLLWGWFVAGSEEDADRCRRLITGSPSRMLLRWSLGAIEKLGLSLGRRRSLALRVRRRRRQDQSIAL